jgi:hypothetical protein
MPEENRPLTPGEKEALHTKKVRLIILVAVTVVSFLAIALFSATDDTVRFNGDTGRDRRGDPGLLFTVGQGPASDPGKTVPSPPASDFNPAERSSPVARPVPVPPAPPADPGAEDAPEGPGAGEGG